LSQLKSVDRSTAEYATHSDFCRIFAEDMNRLYRLSFLLTVDEVKAEACFASALGDCLSGGPVFKEWGRSWARRVLIQNAIRIAEPELKGGGDWRGEPRTVISPAAEPFAAVAKLNPFERFVFVISVLEGYSDQDCAVLLRCRRQQVVDGRLRALQHMGWRGEDRFAPREFAPKHLMAQTA
jgi:hypothetical protein